MSRQRSGELDVEQGTIELCDVCGLRGAGKPVLIPTSKRIFDLWKRKNEVEVEPPRPRVERPTQPIICIEL